MRYGPMTAVVLGLWAGSALSHTTAGSTSPPDGATLDAVPRKLVVSFSEPTRVVKATLVREGAAGEREARLRVPTREPVEELRLTPALAGPGDYELRWRALGVDGHVVTGSFSFRVQ